MPGIEARFNELRGKGSIIPTLREEAESGGASAGEMLARLSEIKGAKSGSKDISQADRDLINDILKKDNEDKKEWIDRYRSIAYAIFRGDYKDTLFDNLPAGHNEIVAAEVGVRAWLENVSTSEKGLTNLGRGGEDGGSGLSRDITTTTLLTKQAERDAMRRLGVDREKLSEMTEPQVRRLVNLGVASGALGSVRGDLETMFQLIKESTPDELTGYMAVLAESASDWAAELPVALGKIDAVAKAMMDSVNPSDKDQQAVLGVGLNGTDFAALMAGFLEFSLSETEKVKDAKEIGVGVWDVVDWLEGNDIEVERGPKTGRWLVDRHMISYRKKTKHKDGSETEEIKYEAVVQVLEHNGKRYAGRDLRVDPTSNTIVGGGVRVVEKTILSPGVEFTPTLLDPKEKAAFEKELKKKNIRGWEVQKIRFIAGRDFEYVDGSGKTRNMTQGSVFFFEDMPKSVREQIRDGKIKADFMWNADVLGEEPQSNGERILTGRSDENDWSASKDFFDFMCKRAGIDPKKLKMAFSEDEIKVGALRGLMTTEAGLITDKSASLLMQTRDNEGNTKRESELTYVKRVLMNFAALFDKGQKVTAVSGSQVTRYDVAHKKSLMWRFWEQSLGMGEYDKDKAISEFDFKMVMFVRVYSDLMGRLGSKASPIFDRKGGWSTEYLVHPLGDTVPGREYKMRPVMFRDEAEIKKLKKEVAQREDEIRYSSAKEDPEQYAFENKMLDNKRKELKKLQEEAEVIEHEIELLFSEESEWFGRNDEEQLINYFVETSRYLFNQKKRTVKRSLTPAEIGEIMQEVDKRIHGLEREVVYKVRGDDGNYREEIKQLTFWERVNSKQAWDRRTGQKQLRNRRGVAAALLGMKSERKKKWASIKGAEHLKSYARPERRLELERLERVAPELLEGWLFAGMYNEQMSWGNIDYGGQDRDVETYFRYLYKIFAANDHLKRLSTSLIHSLRPISLKSLGHVPEDPVGQAAKNWADDIKEFASLTDVMEGPEFEEYIKEVPELVVGTANAYGHLDANLKVQAFGAMCEQIYMQLGVGLPYVYESDAKDAENAGPGNRPSPVEIKLNEFDPGSDRKNLELAIMAYAKKNQIRVFTPREGNPMLVRSAGGTVDHIQGQFHESWGWMPYNHILNDPDHKGVKWVEKYGVREFLRQTALAKVVMSFGRDAGVIYDDYFLYFSEVVVPILDSMKRRGKDLHYLFS